MDGQMLRSYLDMLGKGEITEVAFDGYMWPVGSNLWPSRFVVMRKPNSVWVFEANGYLDRRALSEMCSCTSADIRTIVDLNLQNHYVVH
jgi:hypothetical protein